MSSANRFNYKKYRKSSKTSKSKSSDGEPPEEPVDNNNENDPNLNVHSINLKYDSRYYGFHLYFDKLGEHFAKVQ